MLTQVAAGAHRLTHAYVNCYLVQENGQVLLVDAGLPAMWPMMGRALRALGHSPRDLVGIVLTHAHFDHIGFVSRAQQRLAIPVWAHENDHAIAARPYRYAHENPRSTYLIRHPGALPISWAMARAGAMSVPGVRGLRALVDGQELEAPGRPRVLFTPGHTFGHCALHLPSRDVVISGDALVTLDPYTGVEGPQIVAGAATADSGAALRSLDAIATTGAAVVLPGHGEPWTHGAAAAVELARGVGAH